MLWCRHDLRRLKPPTVIIDDVHLDSGQIVPRVVARAECNVLIHPHHDDAASISVGLENARLRGSRLFA